ncbi:myb-like protein P [Lucilia sericata]|uniref:myb-like protein P n=1 Tax=Lucilia sericata TaxID=13632 RepID=UPI0018A8726B|nr:myb-like protein P [Lucilia sericata]
MRRNLRLDWRALALLGALLSIIIDWPGLVYAMPTILPPVAAITAEAAPTDTLNIIKNDKILNFYTPAVANDQTHQTQQQKDDSKMKNEFNNNQMLNENLKSFSTTATAETTATETPQQPQSQKQRLTTINEKQQVNENYNSISVKEINDKEQQQQQEKITAIHKTTTTQKLQKQQQQQNSQDESAAVEKVSLLKNTHTKNSTINTISLTKSTTKEPTITSPTPFTTTTTTTPTPTTISTTESSAKIQSTLMPSILADQSDEDVEQQQTPKNSHLNKENLINNFKFSSSHHLAILSRTERSIRSSSSSASSANVSSSSGSGSSSSSRGSGGVLVRRSSDMSVLKTKRLNNSRNLHHKNNLDRNERSTVSHLSGPSRKIQLYIKNRFIQLLPDGTVNGTQDEQCDYSK